MRGVTLEAKMRGVERATGLTVILRRPPFDLGFEATDPTVEGEPIYVAPFRLESQATKALKTLHSMIYRGRGREVFRRQGGKCAMCGVQMPSNSYEVDHKHGRGRGRSDRIEDLQAVCTGLNGCQLHRRKHGG